jgi:hypothetical protein
MPAALDVAADLPQTAGVKEIGRVAEWQTLGI